MVKTVKIGSKDIEIRGLTWGEKQRLKEDGIDLANLDPDADNDPVVVRVLELTYGPLALDEAPSAEVYRLFRETVRCTYITEDAAKN